MEGVPAYKLAIDRPSPKLIEFFKKHYNLHSYLSQSNNFLVYREYGLNQMNLLSHPSASRRRTPKGFGVKLIVAQQSVNSTLQEALGGGSPDVPTPADSIFQSLVLTPVAPVEEDRGIMIPVPRTPEKKNLESTENLLKLSRRESGEINPIREKYKKLAIF